MQARKEIVCALPASGFIMPQHRKKPQRQPQQAPNDEATILMPPPPPYQQPQQEADDDQVSDVEEITRAQYRRSLGYFTRIEVDEEDIEPMFRGAIRSTQGSARNSATLRRPKQEGQSSRGKGPCED